MARTDTAVEKLVDIDTVELRLGADVRSVSRLVMQRRIPSIEFAHLLRFDPDDVDASVDGVHVGECRPPSSPDRQRSP